MQARFEAHLTCLSLRDEENWRSILAGAVLPTLHSHVPCKNWNLCEVCWEGCKRKNLHVPTTTEVATTISGILQVFQEECQGYLYLSNGRPYYPPNNQASLVLTSRGKSSQRSGVEEKQQLTSKYNLP